MAQGKRYQLLAGGYDFLILLSVIHIPGIFYASRLSSGVNLFYLFALHALVLGTTVIHHGFIARKVSFCTPGERMAGASQSVSGEKQWQSPYTKSRWLLFLVLYLLFTLPIRTLDGFETPEQYSLPLLLGISLRILTMVFAIYRIGTGRFSWDAVLYMFLFFYILGLRSLMATNLIQGTLVLGYYVSLIVLLAVTARRYKKAGTAEPDTERVAKKSGAVQIGKTVFILVAVLCNTGLILSGTLKPYVKELLIFALEKTIESIEAEKEDEEESRYVLATEGSEDEINWSGVLVALQEQDTLAARSYWNEISVENQLHYSSFKAYDVKPALITDLFRIILTDTSDTVMVNGLEMYQADHEFDTLLTPIIAKLAYSENKDIRYSAAQFLNYDVNMDLETLEGLGLTAKTPRINLDSLQPLLTDSLISTLKEYKKEHSEANSMRFYSSLTFGQFHMEVGERDSADTTYQFTRSVSKRFTDESWREYYYGSPYIIVTYRGADVLLLTEDTAEFSAPFDTMYRQILRSPEVRRIAESLGVVQLGYSIHFVQPDWYDYSTF